jgi:hypothetical protein
MKMTWNNGPLTEVLSWNLSAGTQENYKVTQVSQCPGEGSKRTTAKLQVRSAIAQGDLSDKMGMNGEKR